MYTATEAVGLLASLTSFVVWLPQGVRVWKGRHHPAALQGVVLGTQVVALLGALLWAAYAVLIDSFWVGAPSAVNVPVIVLTIAVVTRARRSESPETCPTTQTRVSVGAA